VFHTVKALHLNARQVAQYIAAYTKASSDFPRDKFHTLQASLQQAETELQNLVTGVVSGTGSPGLLDRLSRLQHQYLDYLSQVSTLVDHLIRVVIMYKFSAV
jgi:hypothetical protein